MQSSDLITKLLEKRGVQNVEAFLNPSYDKHLYDPHMLSHMQKALDRFFYAINAHERIAIYTDFDCDGIASAVVFHDFLKRIGYKNFELYIPHRDKEGYGFHAGAVRELAERGVSLIITADVGISGHEGVNAAALLNVDVIITDHHEVMVGIPNAYAVINPKLGEYPFHDLCGAAVAFKFVQAITAEGRRRELPAFQRLPDGWEKWLLDVVAIATIADMVPLVRENRVLVHYGIRVLRKSRRVGLRELAAVSHMHLPSATEDDVGFLLAPRINAASRMDHPEIAFKLLTTDNSAEASSLAKTLESLNASRKGQVASIVKEAKKRIRERNYTGFVTALGDSLWKPALLGLAANSIMASQGGVVCLWGRDSAGNIKGSCRSDGSVSLVDVFSRSAHVFEQYGGHAQAGGFTLLPSNVHTLQEQLSEAVRDLSSQENIKKVDHDVTIPLSSITETLFRDVSQLAPFGVGNPKPIIHIPDTCVVEVKRFGKENSHVEVTLECPTSGRRFRSYDFFKEPGAFSHAPRVGTEMSFFGTLERDSFRGRNAIAFRIVDFFLDDTINA